MVTIWFARSKYVRTFFSEHPAGTPRSREYGERITGTCSTLQHLLCWLRSQRRGGRYTGMGVLIPELPFSSSQAPVNLRVTVRDLAGNAISQKVITQKLGTFYWMNLGIDFPETNGREGIFVVEPVTCSTDLFPDSAYNSHRTPHSRL